MNKEDSPSNGFFSATIGKQVAEGLSRMTPEEREQARIDWGDGPSLGFILSANSMHVVVDEDGRWFIERDEE